MHKARVITRLGSSISRKIKKYNSRGLTGDKLSNRRMRHQKLKNTIPVLYSIEEKQVPLHCISYRLFRQWEINTSSDHEQKEGAYEKKAKKEKQCPKSSHSSVLSPCVQLSSPWQSVKTSGRHPRGRGKKTLGTTDTHSTPPWDSPLWRAAVK